MVQDRANHFAEATPVPEIEALLNLSNSLSIFDRLMAMPRVETDVANEWDRAVSSRLQTKVSKMMRCRLEHGEECRAA
ncbi:hypothetical protein BO068_005000 [Escherichia coli]|nr:hypothetical protein [Escherichia coli]EFG8200230.1 hypothetical protein [Escherichia coli]